MPLRKAVERVIFLRTLAIVWTITSLPGLFLLGAAIGSRLRGGSDRRLADYLGGIL